MIGIVQEVSDHGLHFLAFLVGAGPLGRGGGKVGGVMKMVPINLSRFYDKSMTFSH